MLLVLGEGPEHGGIDVELLELARVLSGCQGPLVDPRDQTGDRLRGFGLCGIVADLLAGRVDGLGTDEWTARQVAGRADVPIGEICDEWLSLADQLRSALTAEPFLGTRLTGDLIVHIHDIEEALGRPSDPNSEATIAGAHRYVPPLQERVHEQLGIGIDIELTDGTSWPAPGAYKRVSLRATPYDFLRSVTGRRSRADVEALGWTGDPTEILDTSFTSYGKLT